MTEEKPPEGSPTPAPASSLRAGGNRIAEEGASSPPAPNGGPEAPAPAPDAPPPATQEPVAPAEAATASSVAAPLEVPAVEATAPAPVLMTETDKPTVIVRYGVMGLLGRFILGMEEWRSGQRVVIKSDRGQEIGSIVCKWDGCGAPGGIPPQIRGDLLRAVTHADEVEERHLRDSEKREFAFAKQCIAARGLPMKMAAAEHLFGGDRIVFYFVSEQRVDFRALVRDLAHEFQTRIEMRQIGVRDEARLLGDYERCGRPLCCRAWIKELEPVSMKMAKVQKATLDPTKISGRCGRLMCCLRFEHATYRDLARNLPRKNTLVVTAQGRGKVVDTDIVSQLVGVLLETGTRINVPVESLLEREGQPVASPAPDDEAEVPAQAGPDEAAGEPPPEMVAERPVEARPPRDQPLAGAPPRAGSDAISERPEKVSEPLADAAAGPPPASRPPQSGGQPGGQSGQENRNRRGRRRRRGGRNRGRGGPQGGPQAGPQGPGGQSAPPSPPPPQDASPPDTQQGN